jgi:hypothetical protein
MVSIDLVPVDSIEALSDVINESSAAEAAFMDSWHVFMLGYSEYGLISTPP